MGNKSQAPSLAHADQLAREQGFPDYETWKAWNAQRSANLRKPQNYTVAPAGGNMQAGPHENFIQQLMGNLYPPTLLGRVSSAFGNATGTN